MAKQVDVVCHQTEREDRMAEPFDPLLEKQVELIAVQLAIENVLPVIAPQDHMIVCIREMYALSTGH